MFAMESHTDDITVNLGFYREYRWKYLMPKRIYGWIFKNVNYYDTFRNAWKKAGSVDCERKRVENVEYTTNRGYPQRNRNGGILVQYRCLADFSGDILLPYGHESGRFRFKVQVGETESGQGADTAFAQMAAETSGIPFDMVHVMTMQDTDITRLVFSLCVPGRPIWLDFPFGRQQSC